MNMETESAVMERVNWIKQVAATMAIEEMEIDSQTYKNLKQIAARKKTAEQIINEITEEYTNG